MSDVIYAGVKMPLVKINNFSQESIYSEDGLDYLYTKFSMDLQCLLTIDSLKINSGVLPGGLDINQLIVEVRRLILQPRRKFRFSLGHNASEIVEVSGPDPAGGPFPKSFDILEIHGANAAIANFRIEAHATDGCGDDDDILSNRFTVTNVYDQDLYATRTVTGKLVLRGKKDVNPDDFRNVVMPELPHEFRRKSMSFAVSSSGLELGYTIVDQEFFNIDRVSTTSSGTYTESVEKLGTKLYVNVEVALSAPKNPAKKFSKKLLISRAAEIIESRITSQDVVLSHQYTEDMFSNAITLSLRAWRVPQGIGRFKFFLLGETLAKDLPDPSRDITRNLSDEKVLVDGVQIPFNDDSFPATHSADLSIRNKKIIKLAIAAWKEPCTERDLRDVQYVPFDEDLPETDLINPETLEIEVIELKEVVVPEYHSRFISEPLYTDASIEIDYSTTTRTLQLPIAEFIPRALDNPESKSPGLAFDDNVFVELSRPTMTKTITWTFERSNILPDIPEPISDYVVPETGNQIRGKLLSKTISPVSPELLADGKTRIFRISGTYVYGFNRVLQEKEKALDIGRTPWDPNSVTENVISPDRFITGNFDNVHGYTEEAVLCIQNFLPPL